MPKIKLTHRGIDALAAGKWMVDYWDEGLPGFGVRAHHNGRKSFIVRYKVGSTKRRLTLGKHPTMSLAQARSKAKEIIGRVAKGEDPQAERRAERKAETFGELAAEYLERHAKVKKRRWREDERVLQVDLRLGATKKRTISIAAMWASFSMGSWSADLRLWRTERRR